MISLLISASNLYLKLKQHTKISTIIILVCLNYFSLALNWIQFLIYRIQIKYEIKMNEHIYCDYKS